MNSLISVLTQPLTDALALFLLLVFYTALFLFAKALLPLDEQWLDKLLLFVVAFTVIPYVVEAFVFLQKLAQTLTSTLLALIPLITSLLAMAGALFTALSWQPFGLFFIQLLVLFVEKWSLPLLLCAMIFDVCTRLLPALSFAKAAQFIRVFVMSSLTAIAMIFSSVVTISGVAFISVSQAVASPLKKMIEQNIPIIGSLLIESFSVFQKLQTGFTSVISFSVIVTVVIVTFIPAMTLLIHAFALKLAAAILEPFTERSIHELIDDMSKTVFVLTAIAVILAFTIVYLMAFFLLLLQLGMRNG